MAYKSNKIVFVFMYKYIKYIVFFLLMACWMLYYTQTLIAYEPI